MPGTFGPLLEILVPPRRSLGECPDTVLRPEPIDEEASRSAHRGLRVLRGSRDGSRADNVRGAWRARLHRDRATSRLRRRSRPSEPRPRVRSLGVATGSFEHHVHPVGRRGRQHGAPGRIERLPDLQPPSVDASFEQVWKLRKPGSSVVAGRDRRQAGRISASDLHDHRQDHRLALGDLVKYRLRTRRTFCASAEGR